jgi:UDP-2,3-diacylglucosamine hydrolase
VAHEAGQSVGRERPIGLIAGAGDLPLEIAAALSEQGRRVFVAAVEGEADREYSAFPCIVLKMGAVGRLKQFLKDNGCVDVMMAGSFRRPRFSEMEFDLATVKLAASSILRLRFGGDDAAVTGVVRIFEEEGFRVVGPRDAVPELIAPPGPFGRVRPTRAAREDIACGAAAIAHMGPLDIGQAVVVVDRRIVAVEAAEGTTAMAERCGGLRANGRISAEAPSGTLVKMLKPGQESRLELPVIGPDTVRAAQGAGLAGIAVEAGGVLVIARDEVRRIADDAGLFVVGIPPGAGASG